MLDKKTIQKIMGIILFTVVLIACFLNMGIVFKYVGVVLNIVFPFILGAVIAFLINIPMNFFEKRVFENKYVAKNKKLKAMARPLSLVLALSAIVIVVAGVFTIVIPQLSVTIKELGVTVYKFLPVAKEWLNGIIANETYRAYIDEVFNEFDWKALINHAVDFFRSSGNMISSTVGVVSGIFSTTVHIIIGFIFSLYVLLQKEKLNRQYKKIILAVFPVEKSEKIFYVGNLIYKTFSKFVTGQCVEAVILGTLFFIVLSVLRIPYALLVGVVIAFTALIPLVGAFIGCFISAFLILMVSPIQALIFIVVFLILQQIEGNLIYPHVVGSSVGLPSIWVLVAVTLGGSLFGIVGMLVFIPLFSVIYTLLKEWLNGRIKSKKIDINDYI